MAARISPVLGVPSGTSTGFNRFRSLGPLMGAATARILFGIDRRTADGLAFMPGFGGKATDIAAFTNEQVVELANYLLGHYGNAAYSVTPQMVEQVRSGQAPKPLLATLVEVGKWLACAIVILLVLWLIARRFSRTRVRPTGRWMP